MKKQRFVCLLDNLSLFLKKSINQISFTFYNIHFYTYLNINHQSRCKCQNLELNEHKEFLDKPFLTQIDQGSQCSYLYIDSIKIFDPFINSIYVHLPPIQANHCYQNLKWSDFSIDIMYTSYQLGFLMVFCISSLAKLVVNIQ